jgi:GAF domain-containing protein
MNWTAGGVNPELDLLGWCLASGTLAYPAYQDALALVLQRQFRCSTVALWRVNGLAGARTLHSLGRYGANGERLPASEALWETQLGPYFEVLNARGAYACDDARDDMKLDPNGVRHRRPDAPRAFLDALVAINGRARGVLSCCQDFGPRQWQIGEEATLKRVGARVALHLTRVIPPVIDSDCSHCGAGVAE